MHLTISDNCYVLALLHHLSLPFESSKKVFHQRPEMCVLCFVPKKPKHLLIVLET